jgi:hypothetical protein
VRVESGLDLDRDGTLDPDEVTQAEVVCNGGSDAGSGSIPGQGTSGATALVEVEDQLPGEQCATGGKRIDSGLDADADGALDRSEVTDTDYVCNGPAGTRGEKGCGCAIPGARREHTGMPWLSGTAVLVLLAIRRKRARSRQPPQR